MAQVTPVSYTHLDVYKRQVMAFDKIQQAGDISPTVVAGGMKVALITTIFGFVVALILQVFYNYIPVSYTHRDVYKRQV